MTKHGFLFDRCYVLLEEKTDKTGTVHFEHLAVSTYPQMGLYNTSIRFPDEEQEGNITVTYTPPEATHKSITIPLQPDISKLEVVDVAMHGSPTSCFDMGSHYKDFFTDTFGFPVMLVAIGENQRQILFPKSSNPQPAQSSWFFGITKNLPSMGFLTPAEEDEKIKFQDCAPFLVVTDISNNEVSTRLPPGQAMDIRKFRPNIVLSGSKPWDEDFWAEICINEGEEDEIKIPLQHNCIRCVSLNVDFETGKFETENSLQPLKLMQKDRRVDKVKKYSPVFGRYGFSDVASLGKEMKVGDAVRVTKRNGERTGFGKFDALVRDESLLIGRRLAWAMRFRRQGRWRFCFEYKRL